MWSHSVTPSNTDELAPPPLTGRYSLPNPEADSKMTWAVGYISSWLIGLHERILDSLKLRFAKCASLTSCIGLLSKNAI